MQLVRGLVGDSFWSMQQVRGLVGDSFWLMQQVRGPVGDSFWLTQLVHTHPIIRIILCAICKNRCRGHGHYLQLRYRF